MNKSLPRPERSGWELASWSVAAAFNSHFPKLWTDEADPNRVDEIQIKFLVPAIAEAQPKLDFCLLAALWYHPHFVGHYAEFDPINRLEVVSFLDLVDGELTAFSDLMFIVPQSSPQLGQRGQSNLDESRGGFLSNREILVAELLDQFFDLLLLLRRRHWTRFLIAFFGLGCRRRLSTAVFGDLEADNINEQRRTSNCIDRRKAPLPGHGPTPRLTRGQQKLCLA